MCSSPGFPRAGCSRNFIGEVGLREAPFLQACTQADALQVGNKLGDRTPVGASLIHGQGSVALSALRQEMDFQLYSECLGHAVKGAQSRLDAAGLQASDHRLRKIHPFR
jgi:hypothetical protein